LTSFPRNTIFQKQARAIPFFIQVLSAFGIHHVVVHDIDPVTEDDKKDSKSLAHAEEIFRFNEVIKNTVDSSLGMTMPLDPEFDIIFGVSKSQIEKLGKPFAV
jgi:hypothetical protein